MAKEKLEISVVIIAQDCSGQIGDAIASAGFAAEVLVVDGGSKDDTATVASTAGARVEHHAFDTFSNQKWRGIRLASYDWVFLLDSDERITPELEDELRQLRANPTAEGYLAPRLNHYFGKPLYHGGLYPDATIRYFNRVHAKMDNNPVHEKVVIDGQVDTLKNHFIHFAYDSLDDFIRKQNRYSTLGARSNMFKAILNPCWTFFKMYILKAGFLDGWTGFVIARLFSQYTFWKYVKGRFTR
jgi:glycosyltransferase involved in cell wall biosynthesis